MNTIPSAATSQIAMTTRVRRPVTLLEGTSRSNVAATIMGKPCEVASHAMSANGVRGMRDFAISACCKKCICSGKRLTPTKKSPARSAARSPEPTGQLEAATRIALYEAGAEARFIRVDGKTKRTDSGEDFRKVTALGLVPTLIDDDERVLENAAVLQYVARRFPDARRAPRDERGTALLQQWLCFIGTELHKSIYVPLLDQTAHTEVKAYALRKAESRFGWLEQQLQGRSYLLDEFSVADAYLFAVLNWSTVTPVDLKRWPVVQAYQQALGARPSVARAFAEELALYRRELEAEKAAAAS